MGAPPGVELVQPRVGGATGLHVGDEPLRVVGPHHARAPIVQPAQHGSAGDGGGVVASPRAGSSLTQSTAVRSASSTRVSLAPGPACADAGARCDADEGERGCGAKANASVVDPRWNAPIGTEIEGDECDFAPPKTVTCHGNSLWAELCYFPLRLSADCSVSGARSTVWRLDGATEGSSVKATLEVAAEHRTDWRFVGSLPAAQPNPG